MSKYSLARVADRISFLYIEHAKISTKDNAVTITDKTGNYTVPCGSLLAFLLGPGTSITQRAMSIISESGSTVVWCSQSGFKTYSIGESLNHSSSAILRQAECVTNNRLHLKIARKMYQLRFPNDDFTGLSLAKMRGKEGSRMKQIYQNYANTYHVSWSGRNYDPKDYNSADSINQALTTANQLLYGICTAVICSLGFSPALGFIHVGLEKSFVYDIADLYKANISIPVAFNACSQVSNIPLYKLVRIYMRDAITKNKLLKQIVHDLFWLFDIDEPNEINILYLWDNVKHLQQSGIQYEEKR